MEKIELLIFVRGVLVIFCTVDGWPHTLDIIGLLHPDRCSVHTGRFGDRLYVTIYRD